MARKRKQQTATEYDPWDEMPPELQEMLASIFPLLEDRTVIARFPLSREERSKAGEMPGLPSSLQRRLTRANAAFSIGDVVQLLGTAVCGLALLSREHEYLSTIADKLSQWLHDNVDLIEISHEGDEALDRTEALVANAAPRRAHPSEVYRLKIELIDSHPPIWRRIEVGDCTLADLHDHIQTAMGWTNSHLHQFYVGKQSFGDPAQQDDAYGSTSGDTTETWLSELIGERRGKLKFEYEYDFGDSWRHRITVEKKVAADPAVEYPRCLDGEWACPPEDCGGVYGYANLLAVLADPSHEEYQEMREWIGGHFDPADFDAATTTEAMRGGAVDLFDPYD